MAALIAHRINGTWNPFRAAKPLQRAPFDIRVGGGELGVEHLLVRRDRLIPLTLIEEQTATVII